MRGSSITLRDYQVECLDAIESAGDGRWLVVMATGLGKTVVFSRISRPGPILIISHRDELVRQPLRYIPDAGIEQRESRTIRDGALLYPVVSASVQTLSRRLDSFPPDTFHTIITDEAHHAAARTYRRIYDHFHLGRRHIGFTATPSRGDGVGLSSIYDRIIYSRDLIWGITHDWLADIDARRVDIGYDISRVRSRAGDYAIGELSEAVDIEDARQAIAEAARDIGSPPVIIFTVSVSHAESVAGEIPGAVVVSGRTRQPDRERIMRGYAAGEIPWLVNCAIATEGTDLPETRTVIIARPTRSMTLYMQMVGRGCRRTPMKDRMTLIDCVGVTGDHDICTAPTLLGVDLVGVPRESREMIQGDLMELADLTARAADHPRSWVRNVKIIKLYERQRRVSTHGVAWVRLPSGGLTLQLPDIRMDMTPIDHLDRATLMIDGRPVITGHGRDVLTYARRVLDDRHHESGILWDRGRRRRWESEDPTDRQMSMIRSLARRHGLSMELFHGLDITRGSATEIITHMRSRR